MYWVDVCGPPGSGKSTICDPIWGPHELKIENRLPPAEWHDFLNEVVRLLTILKDHWSFIPAVRMNNRSIRKMATVARRDAEEVYIQTGLVQRGLGFGWRLKQHGVDLKELEHYFRLMPVSLGVAFTECPESEIVARNHARETVKETSHENRDFMVPLMREPIEIAKRVLEQRDVKIIYLNTAGSPEGGREKLLRFASEEALNSKAPRCSGEVEALSPPFFWQR